MSDTLQGYTVDQPKEWLREAYELGIAADAIKRESVSGHNFLPIPLTPEQIKQRQSILDIAWAVIEAARKRAMDNFIGHAERKNE